jgi:hypothetical protein
MHRRPLGYASTRLALAVLAAFALASEASSQDAVGGRIVGHVDGARYDTNGAHVWGWACQQGRPESLVVHVYAAPSARDGTKQTFVVAGKADLGNEPAVDRACDDAGGHKHRFDVPLPGALLAGLRGQAIYVHGIRVAGSVENAAIGSSGTLVFPEAPLPRDTPAAYPPLTGTYAAIARHPRVFVSGDQLADMARRINKAGSFSARRFAALSDWVRKELAADLDWDATYSGCDMEIYLRGFSFEPKPAYGNDRSDDELRTAMNGRAGTMPLHGAAVVAARLAFYAALVKAGATLVPGGPAPDQASALAKRILLAWADRGFRDERGEFRGTEAQYCDLDRRGKPMVTQFGTFVGALTLARGIIYSVHGQDLLVYRL